MNKQTKIAIDTEIKRLKEQREKYTNGILQMSNMTNQAKNKMIMELERIGDFQDNIDSIMEKIEKIDKLIESLIKDRG